MCDSLQHQQRALRLRRVARLGHDLPPLHLWQRPFGNTGKDVISGREAVFCQNAVRMTPVFGKEFQLHRISPAGKLGDA